MVRPQTPQAIATRLDGPRVRPSIMFSGLLLMKTFGSKNSPEHGLKLLRLVKLEKIDSLWPKVSRREKSTN